MPIDLLSTLVDAGIAGVFAVFAIVLFREFIKYLTKRDEEMASVTNSVADLATGVAGLTAVITALKEEVTDHAAYMTSRRRDREKTKPRGGADAGKTS